LLVVVNLYYYPLTNVETCHGTSLQPLTKIQKYIILDSWGVFHTYKCG